MKIYGYVEKGIGKSECQDRVLVGDTILAGGFLQVDRETLDNLLIAVADGVGGYTGGELAALMAVNGIRGLNRRQYLAEDDVRMLVKNTHMNIMKTGSELPGMLGMATTLTAFISGKETALSVHIGNCRLWTLRKYIAQITVDQTEVADMVRNGELTPEEAQNHPRRNIITACLGGNEEAHIESLEIVNEEKIGQQQSNIIITSDGIHDYMTDIELESILLEEKDAYRVCRNIAKRAREGGSADDISIVIADRMGIYEN